jgi:hypothetical protein
MRLDRLVIAVPVIVGALATGTAYGYGIGIHPTVRDAVYPVCAHNGVHFNKQGHANCGLHKGWSTAPTASAPQPPANSNGPSGTTTGSAPVRPAHPAHPSHPAAPAQSGSPASSHGHGRGHDQKTAGSDHGSGTHGKSGSAPGHNRG